MSWKDILKLEDIKVISTEQIVQLLNLPSMVEFLNDAVLHKYQRYSGNKVKINKPFQNVKWENVTERTIILTARIKNKGMVKFEITYNPMKLTKNVKVVTDLTYGNRAYGLLDSIKYAIAHNVRAAQQHLGKYDEDDGHYFDTKDLRQENIGSDFLDFVSGR